MTILNLNKSTLWTVFGAAVLYIISWGISAFDPAGNISNLLCGILTCGMILACYAMAIKAFILAKKIEKGKFWYSYCICRISAIQVVVGYGILLMLLGTIKLWAVKALFLPGWETLPYTYHYQAWAFLAQNAMDVLMAGVVLNMMESKYRCAQVLKDRRKGLRGEK